MRDSRTPIIIIFKFLCYEKFYNLIQTKNKKMNYNNFEKKECDQKN